MFFFLCVTDFFYLGKLLTWKTKPGLRAFTQIISGYIFRFSKITDKHKRPSDICALLPLHYAFVATLSFIFRPNKKPWPRMSEKQSFRTFSPRSNKMAATYERKKLVVFYIRSYYYFTAKKGKKVK